MAAGALESLTVSRPRLDLAIPSSRRSSMAAISSASVRRDLVILPGFTGLRVSSRPRRILSAIGSATAKAELRGLVVCEVQESAIEVPDVKKETWQSLVMDCARPVLVEFWAPWCGPCRVTHPVIAKVAKEYEGKLDCFKLNTDECPDLASEYGIRSIPTMIIFKNGEKKDAIIGSVPESTLITCIEKYLGR